MKTLFFSLRSLFFYLYLISILGCDGKIGKEKPLPKSDLIKQKPKVTIHKGVVGVKDTMIAEFEGFDKKISTLIPLSDSISFDTTMIGLSKIILQDKNKKLKLTYKIEENKWTVKDKPFKWNKKASLKK